MKRHGNILPGLDKIWVFGPFALNRVFNFTRGCQRKSYPLWCGHGLKFTSGLLAFFQGQAGAPAQGANGEAVKRKLACVASVSGRVTARNFLPFLFFPLVKCEVK